MSAPPPKEAVSAGLDKVARDVPLRTAFIEAGAAVTRLRGPEAWLEAGAKPTEALTLFLRGQADRQDTGVMAGARYTFDI